MVVKLMGEDGDILFQIDGEFTAQAQGEIQHRPEGTMNQILQIGGLKLPRFGAYSFEILLNNTAVASVPLYVRSRPRRRRPRHELGSGETVGADADVQIGVARTRP